MKAIQNAALAALLGALALPALAQSASTAPTKDPAATPGIDKRQAAQQRRIEQGVKSGQLTPKEAARLEKGQARIQKMEDKAREDGKVTKKERRRIEAAQDAESRRIARERRDKQRVKK